VPSLGEIGQCALLVALLLGPVLAAGLYTLRQPIMAWDGLVIWYAKVRGLYEWRPLAALPLPNYPDLGPACWMSVLKWVGADAENVGRLVFPAFYFMWIVAMLELPRRRRSWVAVVVVAGVAALLFDLEAFTNGYQDGFLMVAAGMSAIFVVKSLVGAGSKTGEPPLEEVLVPAVPTAQGRQDYYLAAFFAGTLGLIKQEGLILGFILMVSWGAAVIAERRPACWRGLLRRLCPVVSIYVALATLWPLLLARNGVNVLMVQGPAFTPSSVIGVLDNLHRWTDIQPYFAEYFWRLRHVFAACVLLSLASLWGLPRTRRAIMFLWTVLGLYLAFVTFTFCATRQLLQWHLDTAFKRLTSHSQFVFALLLCLTVGVLLDRVRPAWAGRSFWLCRSVTSSAAR
jgi:hypothetical protein